MNSTIFTLERNTALLALLGLFAIAIGAGCGPSTPQDQAGTSRTTATNPAPPATASAKPTDSGGPSDHRVLRLDGKTSSMRVANSPSFESLTNTMTLELWFKAASFYKQSGEVNSLLRKNVDAGGENFFLRFRILRGTPVIELSAGGQLLQAPYNFVPGTWYHLAGTFDGETMTALVNGKTIRSRGYNGQIQIDDSQLMIGKGDPNYSMGEYFHGDIDEIRIWNVARSAEQIEAAMNARLTGKEPGLVAYWAFEDGTAKDASTNANNGVLGGEAKVVGIAAADAPPMNASPKE